MPDRPLRRDAERNRQKILGAAGELFARQGLDVSMDQIAEEAGVGIATMYRRFPDKQLLIDALFEERIERIVQVGEEALADTDAWRGFLSFMQRSQKLFSADRGLVDAVFEPVRQGPPRYLNRSRQRLAPIGAELIRRAQAQGRLRADLDNSDLAMLQLMVSFVVRVCGDVSPQIGDRFLGLVVDGLRSTRRAPTALPVAPLSADELDAALARRSAAPIRRTGRNVE